MKKVLLSFAAISLLSIANGQCDTTDVTGDMVISSSTYLSGVYRVSGTFKVNAGKTVFVQAHATNGCGKLEVIANSIVIDGTVNGDFAGYEGGNGGNPGINATSLTGDAVAITSCSNKDNTGLVQLEGGMKGEAGNGPGAGAQAANGGTGSGPKQQCLNTDDASGMIGGSGGAGGGAGAAYGGNGGSGGNGGAGAGTYSATGLSVSSAYPVVGGSAGTGAVAGSTYGTNSGTDIDMGSGGSGAGGGGRSFDSGLAGGKGGNGGGLIILRSETQLQLTGTITANGSDGETGGQGGNGGASPKCCSDGCDDCGEASLSTGAGGAGGAGGGSGGGVLIISNGLATITGAIEAKGGSGGSGGTRGTGTSCSYSATFCGSQSLSSDNGSTGEQGGGGGGGRIKIFVPVCSASTVTPVTDLTGGTGAYSGNPGTYFVGCSELSVAELENNVKFDVFPNPAMETVFVSTSQDLGDVILQLTDMSGRMILSETVSLSDTPCAISVAGIDSGTYQLVAISRGVRMVKKIIKQ